MLTLLAPDFSALDSIWKNPLPFALWPVGHQPLLAHWMDEAVRRGETAVRIYAADRPVEIRQALEGGGYWSRPVEVMAIAQDDAVPPEAVRMDRLPGQEETAAPVDAGALLERWLAMQVFWLENRVAGSVDIDVETMPKGWVGPMARIHPEAVLQPPFWIGARAEIGPGCRVGPYALIGADSMLDARVEVEKAVILPGTYLGMNTRVHQGIAQGGILVDIARRCRVDIGENFIMGSVAQHRAPVNLAGRLGALLLAVLLTPAAKLWPGQQWTGRTVRTATGAAVDLQTGTRGPLLVRRWPWLWQVAAGRFGWTGILPRGSGDMDHLPPETAERLKEAHPGIFSWADVQGCHDVEAPDEWVHAAYQVLQADGTVRHLLRKKIFQLALENPPS